MISERLGFPPVQGEPGRQELLATFFVDTLGTGLFVPISLLYFTRVSHLSLTSVGWCMSSVNLVTVIVPVFAGVLIDRVGPRLAMVIGLTLQGSGFLGYLAVDRVSELFASSLVTGIGMWMFWPAMFALIADLTPPVDRDRWYALTGATRNIGLGLGGLAAALLLTTPGTAVYRPIVLFNGCSFLLAALVVYARVPDGEHRPRRSTAEQGSLRHVPLRRNYPYAALIAINAVFAMCLLMMPLGLPVYVTAALHRPTWVAGALIGTNTVAIAIVQTTVSRLVSRRRRTALLAAAGGLWCVWSVLLATEVHVVQRWMLVTLFGITILFTAASVLHGPTSASLATAAAPEHSRGRYLSVYQLSFAVSGILAPVMFTELYQFDPAAPWLILAALSFCAALAVTRLASYLPTSANLPPSKDLSQ